MKSEATAKDIRRAAMDLLARREHSFQELSDKLSRRFTNSDLIIEQVQQLSDENLQSDQRFAEMFVRSRINKYQGPIRIKNELRERGVSERWVSHAIREEGADWNELIQHLSSNKYGEQPPADAKEKAKRMRFFQYRGFSFDLIQCVL
jgi:regulatory protein